MSCHSTACVLFCLLLGCLLSCSFSTTSKNLRLSLGAEIQEAAGTWLHCCISDLDFNKMSLSGFRLVGYSLHRHTAITYFSRVYFKPHIECMFLYEVMTIRGWSLRLDFEKNSPLWLHESKMELFGINHFIEFHVFLAGQGKTGFQNILSDI